MWYYINLLINTIHIFRELSAKKIRIKTSFDAIQVVEGSIRDEYLKIRLGLPQILQGWPHGLTTRPELD